MGTALHDATNRVATDTAPVIDDDEVIVEVMDDSGAIDAVHREQHRGDVCTCSADVAAPEIIDVVAQDDNDDAVVCIETANSTVHIGGATLAITVRPGKAHC
mgnify:CR=1 FL=1